MNWRYITNNIADNRYLLISKDNIAIIFENYLYWNTTIKTRMCNSVFLSVKFSKIFFLSFVHQNYIIKDSFLHFLFYHYS